MNKVILMGRLTKAPDVRYTQDQKRVARYTLAVDRRYKRDGEQTADFIPCVAFGKQAEFCERWLSKGIKILVTGRIETGSYTGKDGNKVYTTNVIVDDQEFAESKSANKTEETKPKTDDDGFMRVPDTDELDIPFL